MPEPYEAQLAPDLRCRVPLAVPVAEPGAVKPVYYQRTVLERATRLADVLIAWNIFQYFYPYFDVAKTHWAAELPRALRAAATDADAESFRQTLAALVAALKDGHGGVAISLPRCTLPLTGTWADQKLVVTAAPPSGPLRSGDIVRSINGKPAAEALAERAALISRATPQWIRWNALNQLAMLPSDSPVTLVLEPDTRSVSLAPLRQHPPTEPRPVNFSEVKPGVRHVDLGRTSGAEWMANVEQLAKAKAVIFNPCGYPRRSPAFLQHLSMEPLRSAQWHIPLVYRPDRTDMTFTRGGEWNLPAKEPYIGGKRIFLTDGRAISYAESCLGIVEHYKLAEIVGGPTAGTNGNVNPIALPGGVSIMWTGMKVLKHDGSRHHGLGIPPTVPVERTIRGIAEGRDEVLERALALVPE